MLVIDNLNTHKLKSLYEAFEPSRVRELARRLEIHYTPEHGSWLNMAEIEQSVLANQCLSTRIPSIAEMRRQTRAWAERRNKWAERRNKEEGTVNWRFRTEDARIRLKHLHLKIDD